MLPESKSQEVFGFGSAYTMMEQTNCFPENWKTTMHSIRVKHKLLKPLATLLVVSTLFALLYDCQQLLASENLTHPLPPTATNGAIHYHKAILFLYAVDPVKRAALQRPIWELVTPESSDDDIRKMDMLLVESRHAIRAALVGAHQTEADFGLDIRQYMVAALLPHTLPMVDLAKLVTLHGIEQESRGNWKEAAEIYLSTIRMGRHMAQQTTLPEAIAGVEILETGYYALGHWAPHCPDKSLVEEAFELVAAMSGTMVDPARTLQAEASIFQMRLEAMQDAFPTGPWAEMILESLGGDFPSVGPEEMRKLAVEAATSRGVPAEAFQDEESFSAYMKELQSLFVQMANESAQCMCYRSPETIRESERVFVKYQAKLSKAGDVPTRNPAEVAALFTVHEAELAITRLVLAISVARTAQGFPAKVEEVAERFGGELPTSPYDDTAFVYELLEGGKGFSIQVNKTQVGSVELPEIKFIHLPRKI